MYTEISNLNLLAQNRKLVKDKICVDIAVLISRGTLSFTGVVDIGVIAATKLCF
jgi:hypothetical protein